MTQSSSHSFVLENYGYNLTQLAREEPFPSLRGYERVVTRVFDILLRKAKTRAKYNPLVVDGDEMLKRRIVLEVVRRLAAGDAPDPLPSLQVIAPNFAALCGTSSIGPQIVAGTASEREGGLARLLSWPASDAWSSSDEVLSRFQALFSAACQAENHVLLLLIDFHRFVGGEPHPSIDIAPWLVPPLARHEMQLLGTSILPQYRQYIERDAAIQRRVQEIVPQSDEKL